MNIINKNTRSDGYNNSIDNCFSQNVAKQLTYYLYDIEEPEQYTDLCNKIRSLGSNDILKIYINSGGGQVFSALQIIDAIQESQCTVIVKVSGICASAATFIALQAQQVEIAPHAVFMIHNISSGTRGKISEQYSQIMHDNAWTETLFRDLYSGFLTEEEISKVLAGQDMWFNAEEALERYTAFYKYQEEKIEKMEKEQNKSKKKTKNK